MIRSTLRKIVGIGLALCIVGALVLSTPATTMADDNGAAPVPSSLQPPCEDEYD